MGMNDRFNILSGHIYGFMERIFGRGFMRAADLPAGFDANNIGWLQGSFIHSRRGNPYIPVLVHHGDIASGSRCQAIPVNPFDDE